MEDSRSEHMRKFTQSLGDRTWKELVIEAKKLDISVQELIRTHIVPEWYKAKQEKK